MSGRLFVRIFFPSFSFVHSSSSFFSRFIQHSSITLHSSVFLSISRADHASSLTFKYHVTMSHPSSPSALSLSLFQHPCPADSRVIRSSSPWLLSLSALFTAVLGRRSALVLLLFIHLLGCSFHPSGKKPILHVTLSLPALQHQSVCFSSLPAGGAYDAPPDTLVVRGFLPSAIAASRLRRSVPF